MCLTPKMPTIPAAPPLPTALDASALGARAEQQRRQKAALGYNGTLLTGTGAVAPVKPPAPKTLLGG